MAQKIYSSNEALSINPNMLYNTYLVSHGIRLSSLLPLTVLKSLAPNSSNTSLPRAGISAFQCLYLQKMNRCLLPVVLRELAVMAKQSIRLGLFNVTAVPHYLPFLHSPIGRPSSRCPFPILAIVREYPRGDDAEVEHAQAATVSRAACLCAEAEVGSISGQIRAPPPLLKRLSPQPQTPPRASLRRRKN